MTDGPHSYSALSADQQAQLSVWIDRFDRGYEYEGAAALKKALKEAPDELRVVLLSQLLPPLIDQERKQNGRTPTLHELRARFPDLAGELTAAYPLLPSGYRLPVELRGYRVLQVVGEGGQAIVLRAQDDVHSAVAIKLSASPQHNDLLLRERQLLGECQHPGIPEVIASGVEEDRAFFIMPFLRGMTLADKYATHRPSAEEAIRITAELCDIVAHLHSRGILHRDIKPQNVWIDDSGAVKLIDLGMAINRSSWGGPRGAISEFHGSPAFMSPEQAAADSENDGELSDVFSIGATLYWLATGSPPYEGSDREAVLTRAASGNYDSKRLESLRDWPRPLLRACQKAMANDPSRRYRSAQEFGDEISKVDDRPRRSGWHRAALLLALFAIGVTVAVLPAGNRERIRKALAAVSVSQDDPRERSDEVFPAAEISSPVPSESEPVAQPAGQIGDDHDPSPSANADTPLPPPANEVPSKHAPPAAPEGMEYVEMGVGPYLPHHPQGGETKWVLRKREPNSSSPATEQQPQLSQKELVAQAKAWLKSLPPGVELGEFVGRRFHPTTLAPIRSAITSIRLSPKDDTQGAKTYLLGEKTEAFWRVTPERVADNMLRPLRDTDSLEYAFDSRCGVVATPVEEPFIEIEPGCHYLYMAVYFLDGSSIERQLVGNKDKGFAVNLDLPWRSAPQAKVFLFRQPEAHPTDSIANYLKSPLPAVDPHRVFMQRTRCGFYCPVPPYASRIAVSTHPELVKPPDQIVPGTLYVHCFNREGERSRVIRYEITRKQLEELAEAAVYFENELRDQSFFPDGRRREQ